MIISFFILSEYAIFWFFNFLAALRMSLSELGLSRKLFSFLLFLSISSYCKIFSCSVPRLCFACGYLKWKTQFWAVISGDLEERSS
jgi:hypothetical protein